MLTNEFIKKVKEGVRKNKQIVFITHLLEDSGEKKLQFIIKSVLENKNRVELLDLVYTACKEFVMNSTKAAIKRIIFDEMKISDEKVEEAYENAMKNFKNSILTEKFSYFRARLREKDYHTRIAFEQTDFCIKLKVSNNFPLLDSEEIRIREKFRIAQNYDNLPDFFLEHGDETEGAGLGITLVGILMYQSGLDRRLLTIYTSPETNFTIARMEIPITPDYKPKRILFEEILEKEKVTREELRRKWREKTI